MTDRQTQRGAVEGGGRRKQLETRASNLKQNCPDFFAAQSASRKPFRTWAGRKPSAPLRATDAKISA
eukprot:909837-Pyramimonas_sp.AAC.1